MAADPTRDKSRSEPVRMTLKYYTTSPMTAVLLQRGVFREAELTVHEHSFAWEFF
jgi:hypothetical protein